MPPDLRLRGERPRVTRLSRKVLITLGALAIAVFIVVSALRGDVVPGWASTVLPIYVLGGLQIMTIGLVAEYIGKIYSEVKQRPRFISEQELQ